MAASGTGIGEFFVSLAVDAGDGALTVGNFVSAFGALEIATVAEIGALWEMGIALARIIDQGLQASLAFEQFSIHTGLSAQELQKWQIVAQQAHASAEDVTRGVESLTKHLANLAIGIPDSALGALQQLFISPFDGEGKRKNAFEVLDEVRHKLGSIRDVAQQTRIIEALGIPANLRETLTMTDSQFKALAATAHGMTLGQEQSFDRMRQLFVQIELVTKDIGLDIVAWVVKLEPIANALKTTLETLKEMRAFLEGGAANLAHNITTDFNKNMAVQKAGGNVTFKDSILYKYFLAPTALAAAKYEARQMYPDFDFSKRGGGGTVVHVDKHDTYHIHDAHDPRKITDIMERSWDEILGRRTVDGFDRQNLNGGF